MDFGSGGFGAYGGGSIRLTVTGDVVNDGTISAVGATVGTSCGSGGSVWLAVGGTLTGTGSISANGGSRLGWEWTTGGGGRVAVFLTGVDSTFTDYAGTITATAGPKGQGDWFTVGGAGTVYRVSAQEGERLDVANFAGALTNDYSWTTLGTDAKTALRNAAITVTNGATLRLEQDTYAKDLVLAEDCVLDLGTYTLRIYGKQHALPGTVIGCGNIGWIETPTVIIVR